jgi:hypothetical protein
MGRIRTVKPELFKHGGLFDAEQETGLPLRLAFIGMFTVCDREGRFKWRPRELKLDVLPYDAVDFSCVLDALATRGYLVKYESAGVEYGCIPTWNAHQSINNKETESKIPPPNVSNNLTREARVDDALSTPLNNARGEGKGREGDNDASITAEMVAKEGLGKALITSDKVFRQVVEQIKLKQVAFANEEASALVDKIADAWKRFGEAKDRLDFSFGAEKFFGEGYWQDERRWPWKEGNAPKSSAVQSLHPIFEHKSNAVSIEEMRRAAGIQ